MTSNGKRKNSTFYLAVVLFVAAQFARATEGFRLRKTERRDGRKDAAAGFQPGRVVFGNVFEKRPSVDAQPWDGAQTSAASTEEEANYQGDSPVLQPPIPPEMKAMDPSVMCGQDKMKFMVQAVNLQKLAMDPGPAAPPVPLPQVPSPCGYNVQRDPASLVMMAPYSGCFMLQQGAYYVLPMRWQDTQFSLWCPMPPVVQPTPATRPTQVPNIQPPYFFPPWDPRSKVPQVPQVPHIPQIPQFPQVPQIPQFPQVPQIPQFPQIPQVPHTPQVPQVPQVPQIPQVPKIPQVPQIPQIPQVPQIPHMPFPKFPPWNPYPEPVTPPSTAPPTFTLPTPPQPTASKTGAQQPFQALFYPLPHPLYAPSFPWGIPMFPPAAEPPVKMQSGQMPQSSFSYPYNIPPMFPPFPQPPGKQSPGKVHPHFPPYIPFPMKLMRYPPA